MSRIAEKFAALKAENRSAFIPFIMAGDPTLEISSEILLGLPQAGADLIELGVAFTDPMADGPAIQAAGLRALEAGQTLRKTLEMVRSFRSQDDVTPIILMGYFNPIYSYGVDAFLKDAHSAGVDGLIVVDLPPEEDDELCAPALAAGIDFIRLATPTTDEIRLPNVIRNTSGFVYYVSVAGVTGQKSGVSKDISSAVAMLQKASGLPVAVGFGVKTVEKVKEIGGFADAVVVGSALIETLENTYSNSALETGGVSSDKVVKAVLTKARDLAQAVHDARKE